MLFEHNTCWFQYMSLVTVLPYAWNCRGEKITSLWVQEEDWEEECEEEAWDEDDWQDWKQDRIYIHVVLGQPWQMMGWGLLRFNSSKHETSWNFLAKRICSCEGSKVDHKWSLKQNQEKSFFGGGILGVRLNMNPGVVWDIWIGFVVAAVRRGIVLLGAAAKKQVVCRDGGHRSENVSMRQVGLPKLNVWKTMENLK